MCVIPLGGPAGEASDLRDAERRAAPSASDPRSTEAPGPTTTAWGRCLLGAHLRRVLGADERAQALVLVPAGGAAFEVRPEARDGGVGGKGEAVDGLRLRVEDGNTGRRRERVAPEQPGEDDCRRRRGESIG